MIFCGTDYLVEEKQVGIHDWGKGGQLVLCELNSYSQEYKWVILVVSGSNPLFCSKHVVMLCQNMHIFIC